MAQYAAYHPAAEISCAVRANDKDRADDGELQPTAEIFFKVGSGQHEETDALLFRVHVAVDTTGAHDHQHDSDDHRGTTDAVKGGACDVVDIHIQVKQCCLIAEEEVDYEEGSEGTKNEA